MNRQVLFIGTLVTAALAVVSLGAAQQNGAAGLPELRAVRVPPFDAPVESLVTVSCDQPFQILTLYVENVEDSFDDNASTFVAVDPDGPGPFTTTSPSPAAIGFNHFSGDLSGSKFVYTFDSVSLDAHGTVAIQYEDPSDEFDTTNALWMVLTTVSARCSATHI